jgi:hypothetical protein
LPTVPQLGRQELDIPESKVFLSSYATSVQSVQVTTQLTLGGLKSPVKGSMAEHFLLETLLGPHLHLPSQKSV